MPKPPMLVVLTVCGLALAGCAKSTTAQPLVTSPTGPPSATTAAAPCPATVTSRKGALDDQLTFEGLNRTYRVWIPATYSGDVALPIIVNYHGTGGDPQSIDDFSSNLSAKANARNYIVVAPQAEKAEKSAVAWTIPGISTTPDDVSFTNAMLDKLSSEFCIDQNRIFATGFSSGGAMTTWIGQADSERFAAIAPGGGVNLVDPTFQRFPIPIYAYHGTKDELAFYNGIDGVPNKPDPVNRGKVAFFGGVEEVMTSWAQGNGCQPTFTDTNLAPDAILRTWAGCKAATQVLLAVGGGHTFPGGTTRSGGDLGATITSVNMADLMLNWFDTQRRLSQRSIAGSLGLKRD